MSDIRSVTKIAWDIGRDGYFVHTAWDAADRHAKDGRRIFFINLIRSDGSMIFLGNYNQVGNEECIRASQVAHEQLKLVLGLSAHDRHNLHTHPGRKMTVDEIAAKREQTKDSPVPEADVIEDEKLKIKTPLRMIKRNDVVNEPTKAAMRAYVGDQTTERMREALDVFLTRTPNGGSTRRFLQLQHLQADTIEVSPKEMLPNGEPDHTKGYDITLTCSLLAGP